MRTSIRDVAERAGVSAMTVSSILRGRTGEAAAETHERVLKAVHELNYIPIRSARQNQRVQTHVLGIAFDYVDAATDIWGLALFQGIRQGALKHGYDLLVLLRPMPLWAAGREEAQFLQQRADGYIFVAPYRRDQVLAKLVQSGIPMISVYESEVPDGVSYAGGNNTEAARTATQHLIERGHSRIGYLAGDLDKSYFRNREEGYRSAMTAAGLNPFVLGSLAEGMPVQRADVQELLSSEVTAIVAANDMYAVDLLKFANEAGLKVPNDLSVISIDGIPPAATAGLTTVQIDNPEIGRQAVEALVKRINGADWTHCHRVVAGTIVERTSVQSCH